MSKILSDAFSIFDLNKYVGYIATDYNFNHYKDVWHIIENLILTEKIHVVKEAVENLGIDDTLHKFRDEIEILDYDSVSANNRIKLVLTKDLKDRGVVYSKIANEQGIYFSPHPYRQKVLNELISDKIKKVSEIIIDKFDQKISVSEDGEYACVNINIPPIIEHVIEHSKRNNLTIFNSILEIRNDNNTICFRKFCIDLDNELAERAPRKRMVLLNALLKDLNKVANNWHSNLKDGFHSKQRKINLTKTPILGNFFDMLDVKEIEFNDPIINHDQPYLFFINDLYND